jgi:hypothetical protein
MHLKAGWQSAMFVPVDSTHAKIMAANRSRLQRIASSEGSSSDSLQKWLNPSSHSFASALSSPDSPGSSFSGWAVPALH